MPRVCNVNKIQKDLSVRVRDNDAYTLQFEKLDIFVFLSLALDKQENVQQRMPRRHACVSFYDCKIFVSGVIKANRLCFV